MSKNKKIVCGVVGVIVLIGVFYSGTLYGKNQTKSSTTGVAFTGTRTRGSGFGGGNFGGATNGQIIAKDATSITVSLQSGGSKIIFLDSSTPISKQISGTMADLTVGTNVIVAGTTNSDGSVTAQSVQVRPNMPRNTTTPTTAPSVVQ